MGKVIHMAGAVMVDQVAMEVAGEVAKAEAGIVDGVDGMEVVALLNLVPPMGGRLTRGDVSGDR
jgi:hypothetical protein